MCRAQGSEVLGPHSDGDRVGAYLRVETQAGPACNSNARSVCGKEDWPRAYGHLAGCYGEEVLAKHNIRDGHLAVQSVIHHRLRAASFLHIWLEDDDQRLTRRGPHEVSSTVSDRTGRLFCEALLAFLEILREPESLLASGILFLAFVGGLGGPRLLETGTFTGASSLRVGSLSAMAQ